MKDFKIAVIATLIGTGAGTWAWIGGFAKLVWPKHPFIAVLIITAVATEAVRRLWPADWLKS
jgi:hypothetical protein